MIAPITNFPVKGFVWYQGESNADRPREYKKLLPALIDDWRAKWNQVQAPFLYVQLPNFMDMNYSPSESKWAELREAQFEALRIPHVGMAVAIDLGEWNDIHPDNKKPIGDRLALAARKVAYEEDLTYSGPIYQSSRVEGSRIRLIFTQIGSGLISIDGEELTHFAVAGSDKKFVWANAIIEGDNVIVWSDVVPEPRFVRYAWADNPQGANLYNKERLPASPFRTDN
jgi:sialate O-acetylesterase